MWGVSTEKNLRLLKRVDEALRSAGERNYRFEIIGHGAESDWLSKNLSNTHLPGVLLGKDLAEAYAGIDVFLLPVAHGHVRKRGMGSFRVGRALLGHGQRRTAIHHP